jgi:hypothetical protein
VEAVRLPASCHRRIERRASAVTALHPIKDKRARLRVATRYIKIGFVKFPRPGCEQLLTQLLRFESEKHYERSMPRLSCPWLRSRRDRRAEGALRLSARLKIMQQLCIDKAHINTEYCNSVDHFSLKFPC